MTLIIGLNSSNGLYLGADTRVTFKTQGGENYKDNINKISGLGDNENVIAAKNSRGHMLVSVAGNVALASYVFKILSKAVKNKELSTDIFHFKRRVSEYLVPFADSWFSSLGGTYEQQCILMFAGFSHRQMKKIDAQRFKELIEIYKKEKRKHFDFEKAKEAKETFLNNPIAQEMVQRGLPLDRLEKAFNGSIQMDIPETIQRAIETDGIIEGQVASHIFALSVGIKGVSVVGDAEWGEFIAYGGGNKQGEKIIIDKYKISSDLLADIELSHMKKNSVGGFWERHAITMEIKDFSKKKKIPQIGDTVLVYSVHQDEFYPLLESQKTFPEGENIFQMEVIPNRGLFFQKGSSAWEQLVPFYCYKKFGDACI